MSMLKTIMSTTILAVNEVHGINKVFATYEICNIDSLW